MDGKVFYMAPIIFKGEINLSGEEIHHIRSSHNDVVEKNKYIYFWRDLEDDPKPVLPKKSFRPMITGSIFRNVSMYGTDNLPEYFKQYINDPLEESVKELQAMSPLAV